jgi:hypothetical protein
VTSRRVPGSSERRVWTALTSAHPICGLSHGQAKGALDERDRRLSHEEFDVARGLASEGHTVRSLAALRGFGPTADLDVCGTRVEVKSWLPASDRDGRPPTARSVLNKLLKARTQASAVVLNGHGSGLSAAAARGGMAMYASRSDGGRLRVVRVVGDGFDLSWGQHVTLARTVRAGPAVRLGTSR